MKTLILAAKKASKPVIKHLLILIVGYSCFNTLIAQQSDTDYLITKFIIDKIELKDKEYNIRQLKFSSTNTIKRYYDFRTKNRPFYTFFAIDSISGEEYIDSIPKKEQLLKWRKKYHALDSLFTIEEIKHIMDEEMKTELWDSTYPVFNKKSLPIKWCNDNYCRNAISQPYYNKTKNRAIIISSHKEYVYPTLYVFLKVDDYWEEYTEIDGFGW